MMSNAFVKFLESVGENASYIFLFLKSNKKYIVWIIKVTNDSESAQIIRLFSSWLKKILAKIFVIKRCQKMALIFCLFLKMR